MVGQLHGIQIAILYKLRREPSARFSELMRQAGLQSDVFKFHLQKLVKFGYVEKTQSGDYALTQTGKEFANNLDRSQRSIQRQPKLSVLVSVQRKSGSDQEFLVQQRLRNPFYGYWADIGGPVKWGETALQAAMRELQKQTGLTGQCIERALYRKRDFSKESGELLEDKLFIVLEATVRSGKLLHTWGGGRNEWMTIEQLAKQPKCFSLGYEIIKLAKQGFYAEDMRYSVDEY